MSEKVQTSQRGDGLENEAIKCVELEKQIREQIQEFTNKKKYNHIKDSGFDRHKVYPSSIQTLCKIYEL